MNQCVLSLTFRHYGSFHFSMSKWNDVKNSKKSFMRFKPFGGLWASPVGEEFCTWESFIETDYETYEGRNQYFDFNLAPFTKVFVVRSKEDLDTLVSKYGSIIKDDFPTEIVEIAIDYESMQKDNFEAVYFELSSDERLYELLYGMDVDSLIVLNPKCIVEKKELVY